MFLNFLKTFLAKRVLNKGSLNVKSEVNDQVIKTIGVIIDETYFHQKEALIMELATQGIDLQNIKLITYKNRYKKREIPEEPFYTNKHITWLGAIEKQEVQYFIDTPFDLLISYYDVQKVPLLIVTHQSKASFKSGLTSADDNVNHLSVDTSIANYKVFVEELVKYLRILKKL
jgi:hypothetical protein